MVLSARVAGLSLGQEALDTALERSLPRATTFPCPALSRSERSQFLLSSKVPPWSDSQGELRACSPGTIVSAGWLRTTQSWIYSSTFEPCPPPSLLLSLGHHDSPKRLYPWDVGSGWVWAGDGGTPHSPRAGACRWQDAAEVWEVPFFSAGSM